MKKGQSLVEIALIAPLLVLIFIGVIEVGALMIDYMIVAQANRDAARYAVRNASRYKDNNFPPPLDFSKQGMEEIGWYKLKEEFMRSILAAPLTGELRLDGLHKNATLYFHHFYVMTGWPCETHPCPPCDQVEPGDWYAADDLVLSPSTLVTYTVKFGDGHPSKIRDIYPEIEADLVDANNRLNCLAFNRLTDKQLEVGGFIPSDNSVIIAEVTYDHSQVLGFPVMSNFANPIKIYHTTWIRRKE